MAEPLRDYVIDNFGRPVSGASVSVKIAGTANDAALFSDDALTAGVSNPLTTEADGSFYAYAANGKYDLVVTKTGYTGDPTDTSGLVLWDEQITKTVTATYSQSLNDYILLADASSAPFTINLLALSGVAAGRPWIIIKVDSTANAVTIDPSGAETINGASTLVLSAAKQGVVIRKGTTEWQTDLPPAQTIFGTGKIPLGRVSDGKLDPGWLDVLWTGPAPLGAALSISSIGVPALTALDSTTVAHADSALDELRTYRFDGSTWAQVGTGLTIAGMGVTGLAALNSTDIAHADDSILELRTYRFNGSTWAQVGTGLIIAGVSYASITALNSTDIAFVDDALDELRTYRFDGSTWAQVGTGLAVTGANSPKIAALNSTDVAFIENVSDELRTYRFDGSTWAQVGSSFKVLNLGSQAIAALNGTDIAIVDTQEDSLRTYRFAFSLSKPFRLV